MVDEEGNDADGADVDNGEQDKDARIPCICLPAPSPSPSITSGLGCVMTRLIAFPNKEFRTAIAPITTQKLFR